MPRILVADDHTLFRRGAEAFLKKAISGASIGEAETPEEVLDLIRQERWDLLLLDFSMPGRSGTELIREIRQHSPKVPILILSGHPEEEFGVQAIRAGASGFVNKARSPNEIIAAVKKVLAGGRYVTPELAERLAEVIASDAEAAPHARLSGRELQILQRIAAGKSVKEIANELKLSVATVGTYRARVLEKMGLKTNGQLMRYALDQHLAD